MDNFEEFEQDLNRMPFNMRSSLIDKHDNKRTFGEEKYSRRNQSNKQIIDSSQYFVENAPRRERNFQIYEDTPRSMAKESNLRARYIDPNFRDSELATIARNHTRTATSFGGFKNQDFKDDEFYNTSGRTLHLSDFAGYRNDNSQEHETCNRSTDRSYQAKVHSALFDDSGRPTNLSESEDQGLSNHSCQPLTAEELSQSGQFVQVPRTPNAYYGHNLTEGESSRAFKKGRDGSMYSSTWDPCVSIQKPYETQTCKIRLDTSPSADLSAECIKFQNDLTSSGKNVSSCRQLSLECPRLSQNHLLQFLQSGDLNKIRCGDDISSRNPLFNILVKDNYYPGAIDDAVNGHIDFNRVAFDAVFDNNNIPNQIKPEDVPLSLLEAFDLRIQYEKEMQEDLRRRTTFCMKDQMKKSIPKKTDAEKDDEEKHSLPSSNDVKFWCHRDELKLASTVEIDLWTTNCEHPETGLTKAIACLFKAEKMNSYDRYVHMAEEAIRTATASEHEKAALRSQCSFQVDMQKQEMKPDKTFKPLEIIAYIGTTKPSE